LAYLGEKLYMEIVDNEAGGWGHLNLDDVNVPTTGDPDPHMTAESQPNAEEPTPAPIEAELDEAEVSPAETPTHPEARDSLPVQWIVTGLAAVLIALGGGAYLRRRSQSSKKGV
jgi:hypothetical protein